MCSCLPHQVADTSNEQMDPHPSGSQRTTAALKGVPSSLSVQINRIMLANYDSIPMAVFADTVNAVRLSDTVEVYCFRVRYGAMHSDYVCLAFNKQSQQSSPAAVRVSGQWMSDAERGFPPSLRLMTKGLLSVQFYGGRTLLCLSERRHNGTVYNAVVDYYFDINSALEFSPVMSVESRCKLPEEDGAWYVDRILNDGSVQSIVTDEVGRSRTLFGQYDPALMNPPVCYKEEYCRYVVTCSGGDNLSPTWSILHP